MFYRRLGERGKFSGAIKGFPLTKGSWCKKLKVEEIDIRGHLLQEIQGRKEGSVYGFPIINSPWCTSELKTSILDRHIRMAVHWPWDGMVPTAQKVCLTDFRSPSDVGNGANSSKREFSKSPTHEGRKIKIVQYLGIAADEPIRVARHIVKPDVILPLVELGWEEGLCGLIAKYQDLLSPTYTEETLRNGCWFCHNQGVHQLRLLRRNYPEHWQLLLKWDKDSPVSFKPDGHTVHDFDERFQMEDDGLINPKDKWRWEYLNCFQLRI